MKKKSVVFEIVPDVGEGEDVKIFFKKDNENVGKLIFKKKQYGFDLINLRDRIFELLEFYDL